MKKKTIWWIIGIIVLLVVVIIVGKSRGNKGTKVVVEAAARHTIIETVTANGKIYPETEVKISPEVSGEIIELTKEEGDSVQKGELLVKINPAVYNSMVNQASANLSQSKSSAQNVKEMVQQAKSQYDLNLATYERNKKLYKEKVISQLEFEQAEANYKSSLASYQAAKANASGGGYGIDAANANLSQAMENLRKTTIFAPTSGIISQLNVKKGERVVGTAQMAGTEMLTIADMSRMEVRVNVSETDIAKVKIGDTTIIEADAYSGKTFRGLVSKIAVSSGAAATTATSGGVNTDQVTNYTVYIYILPSSYEELTQRMVGNKLGVFKPGMSSSVEIMTHTEKDVLSIPVNAVTTRDWPDSVAKTMTPSVEKIRQVVFVYNRKTNQVSIRDVHTGLQDNLYIQITSGLKEGEEVVTAPYGAIARLLKDNSQVQVVEKEALFEAKE